MKNYFHVPELDLTNEQRSKLTSKLQSTSDTEISKLTSEQSQALINNLSTSYANLDFISEFFDENILNDIELVASYYDPNDWWTKTSSYEFVQSSGPIERHRDVVRHATILFPVHDPEQCKMEWWNQEETAIVDTLNYDYKTWILNIKSPHSMSTAYKPRINFQASIYGYTFDEVKKMYESGKIFKS